MPRKTRHPGVDVLAPHATSMRPRLDAAENAVARLAPRLRQPTSMRPRLDAAENDVRRDVPRSEVSTSMRPRLDAAENTVVKDWLAGQT